MPDLAKFEKNCSEAGETCLRQRCRRSFRKSWKRECKNFKAGRPAGGGREAVSLFGPYVKFG